MSEPTATPTIDGPGAAGAATLLGSVELVGPGGQRVTVSRPQVQVVLAHLLLERGPISQGQLADLLWGDRPLSAHWRGAVRGVLSKLREVFLAAGVDAEVVAAPDGTVRLVVDPTFRSDVEQARRAVDQAAHALGAGQAADAVDAVRPWVDRLQLRFLAAGDGDWVRSAQEGLHDLARRAVTLEVQGLLALERPAEAAERAAAWVRIHALDEGVHHLLIQALVSDGRRTEARAALARLRDVLGAELGLGPAAATVALVGPDLADGRGRLAGGAATSTLTPTRTPTPTSPVAAGLVGHDPARPLVADAATPFLGRSAELDALEQAWSSVESTASPQMVVLAGPSGIGKTRVAQELVHRLSERDATVAWGRCRAGSGLPFEPLTSAVLGAERAASLLDEVTDDPALARAHVVRSIRSGAQELASSPAVLVLDDLQWASDDVVLLLEEVLSGLSAPLLVVATGRNLPPTVHESLARLHREVTVRTVRLSGLEPVDLLPLFADGDPDGLVAAEELHRRTAGHPFFVTQIASASAQRHGPIDVRQVPDAVRDWIGHRIDALDRTVRARLDLAAVMGPEVAVSALAHCAHADRDDVLDQVEHLVEQGLLVETGAVDVFAFAHLITQETVYDRLGPTRRARLHAAVAEALQSAPQAPGRHAAIARHLRAAGPDHAAAAAIHSVAAGREALDQGAWSLAADLYWAALADADEVPQARAEALTGLGQALHHLRHRDDAEATLNEALAVARVHDLPLEFAEAVLALVGRAGRGVTQHLSDQEQAELLREALAGLDRLFAADPTPADRELAVRRDLVACEVEGELALALLLTTSTTERSALVGRALDRARRMTPPDHRLTARALLSARVAKLGPEQLTERLHDLDQVLAIPAGDRSVEVTVRAETYRHEDRLRLGDRAGARVSLRDAADLAARFEHPYWVWATTAWQALDAVIDGDLVVAEEKAATALGLQGAEEAGALACFGVNLVNIRLYQGRSGEVIDLLAQASDEHPEIPCYRAVLALCCVEAGDLAAGTRAYDVFRADGFTTIPEDTNLLLTLAVLADAAVQLGDAASAPRLAELLAPYRGQQALLNCYGGGGAFWGPVDHQLARLAAAAGQADEAATLFASAAQSAEQVGSPLVSARIASDPLRTQH